MSRETQYIGLTQAARDFVAQCEPLPHDTHATGMFDEEIPLGKWAMHPVLQNDGRPDACIREVVQCVPWSSGPMIFTMLELHWGNGASCTAYEWIADPTLGRAFCQYRENLRWEQEHPGEECRSIIIGGEEYDCEKGTMWV